MKTKIVNGKREWANDEQTCAVQKTYGLTDQNLFHFQWVEDLLIDELGFVPAITVSSNQAYVLSSGGVSLEVFWDEEDLLAIPNRSGKGGPHRRIYILKDLLNELRKEWEALSAL